MKITTLLLVLLLGSYSLNAVAGRKIGSVIVIENQGKSKLADFLMEAVGVYIYARNMSRSYHKNYYLVDRNANETKIRDTLTKASKENHYVDVYTIVHGNKDGIGLNKNVSAVDDRSLDDDEIAGFDYPRLRFVYQNNCYGMHLNDDWISAGADSVIGPPKVNVLPHAYYPIFTSVFKLRSIRVRYLKRYGFLRWRWVARRIYISRTLKSSMNISWFWSRIIEDLSRRIAGYSKSEVGSKKKLRGSGSLRVHHGR